MKRTLSALLGCVVMLMCLPMMAHAQPSISAEAACVVEVSTGRILYSKNGEAQLPMASTTKVMTALLAVESGRLDEVITISEEACGIEGSSVYLETGEQFQLRDLVYALMLRSGNDAATAIALALGGTVEEFVSMMNERALELGATHTHFNNPHGLPDDEHYTTAEDLALISAVAMRNEEYAEIVGTKYFEMKPDGNGTQRTLQNKNKLLWNYEGATGGKTGYTIRAGKCLVSSSKRDSLEVVCIVLNCPNMWEDSMTLMDYAHETYTLETVLEDETEICTIPVLDGMEETASIVCANGYSYPVLKNQQEKITTFSEVPQSLVAPVTQGEVIGMLYVQLDGETIETLPLTARKDIKVKPFYRKIWDWLTGWISH